VEAVWAVLEFPEREAYNDSFDSAGYNYNYSIENLGTAFVLIHIYVFMTILCFILLYFDCTRTLIHRIFAKVMDNLFYGVLLRFIFEGYLEIAIAVCISLIKIEWSLELGSAVLYCNFFTILMTLGLILLPIYILFYYTANIEKMDDEKFKS